MISNIWMHLFFLWIFTMSHSLWLKCEMSALLFLSSRILQWWFTEWWVFFIPRFRPIILYYGAHKPNRSTTSVSLVEKESLKSSLRDNTWDNLQFADWNIWLELSWADPLPLKTPLIWFTETGRLNLDQSQTKLNVSNCRK